MMPMFFVYVSDQITAILMLCFSFLIASVVIAMNNENNSFSRAFGLSFIGVFILALISIFYPDSVLRLQIIRHMGTVCLGLFFMVFLIWRWKSITSTVLISLAYPFMLLLGFVYLKNYEVYLSRPLLLEGIVLILCIGTVVLQRKTIRLIPSHIDWGISLLALGQIVEYTFPVKGGFFSVFCQLTAFLLFSVFVFKMVREEYLSKLIAAEKKLADVNKTINYEVKKRIFEIEMHNEHLLNLAQRDPLVNALNKKGILAYFKDLIENPKTKEFAIMLFDIDDFKAINDTKGHISGDFYLKQVAKIARESIRDIDFFGRYGGDEFLVILPNTNLADVSIVAERFRAKINQEPNISVSIGLASFPEDGTTVEELLKAADAGLYLSKKRGKNAVSHIRTSGK